MIAKIFSPFKSVFSECILKAIVAWSLYGEVLIRVTHLSTAIFPHYSLQNVFKLCQVKLRLGHLLTQEHPFHCL